MSSTATHTNLFGETVEDTPTPPNHTETGPPPRFDQFVDTGWLHSVSYGGGQQSTAQLVLAAQGVIPFKNFLFANVGEQMEDPETLAYVRAIAMPYAEEHGLNLVEVQKTKKDGSVEDLWVRMTKDGSRSMPIPIRGENGAPGSRSCTAEFKARVLNKWVTAHGATPDEPAIVALGISIDEIERINNRRLAKNEITVYPLIDLRLSRGDCQQIIADAGLPVPPPSSCFACPFHSLAHWSEMRERRPELFEKAQWLEDFLNERLRAEGKRLVYLTRYGKRLSDAVPEGQERLALDVFTTDATCDTGHCFV